MDFIHRTPRGTIYTPNEYYVNMDMAIPFGLARGGPLQFGPRFPMRYSAPPRPLYVHNRTPAFTPLVLARTFLPMQAHRRNVPPG